MGSQKVAVVTGGNRGIGYAIVKGLCERFKGIVYLTARDANAGKAALAQIEKESNFKPLFHQLDVNDQGSVDAFRDFIKKEHGGLDLLINNAGIAFKYSSTDPVGVQARETVKTNYFGVLRVCEALFPLLRENARVVNLSSSAGHLYKIPSEDIRKLFRKNDLTIPELNKIMEGFVKSAEDNKSVEEGWGTSTYVVSKVGLTALSFIQQRMFDEEKPNRNITVNATHPGYVDTELTSHKGPWTIEQGANSTLFLALDADLKGKFIWSDCKVVDWYSDSAPTYL